MIFIFINYSWEKNLSFSVGINGKYMYWEFEDLFFN